MRRQTHDSVPWGLFGYAMFALAAGILTSPACGATIDTLDFTESNWSSYAVGSGVQSPVLGTLTGSFTGTVEAAGLIEQGDLTAFGVTFSVNGLSEGSISLPDLTLFSYNLSGGASSLDIAGIGAPFNICVGAATALDPKCTIDFAVAYPAGTVGVVELAGVPDFVSSSFPTITLVSSVTTVTTPEPHYAPLMGIVLIVIGLLRRRETRACEANELFAVAAQPDPPLPRLPMTDSK